MNVSVFLVNVYSLLWCPTIRNWLATPLNSAKTSDLNNMSVMIASYTQKKIHSPASKKKVMEGCDGMKLTV